eukprot:365456-Chlamydomonas_euryale.AAC.15
MISSRHATTTKRLPFCMHAVCSGPVARPISPVSLRDGPAEHAKDALVGMVCRNPVRDRALRHGHAGFKHRHGGFQRHGCVQRRHGECSCAPGGSTTPPISHGQRAGALSPTDN